jgi:hypothetical protein
VDQWDGQDCQHGSSQVDFWLALNLTNAYMVPVISTTPCLCTRHAQLHLILHHSHHLFCQ